MKHMKRMNRQGLLEQLANVTEHFYICHDCHVPTGPCESNACNACHWSMLSRHPDSLPPIPRGRLWSPARPASCHGECCIDIADMHWHALIQGTLPRGTTLQSRNSSRPWKFKMNQNQLRFTGVLSMIWACMFCMLNAEWTLYQT